MNENPLRALARLHDYQDSIAILFRNNTHVVKPITLELKEQGVHIEPSIILDMDMAQQLMNELWVCGLRPSKGVSSTGQIEALHSHLDDLRKIAFKQLKID